MVAVVVYLTRIMASIVKACCRVQPHDSFWNSFQQQVANWLRVACQGHNHCAILACYRAELPVKGKWPVRGTTACKGRMAC